MNVEKVEKKSKAAAPTMVEFSLAKSSLVDLFQAIGSISSKKTAIDATCNVLFELYPSELVLKSTDLDMSFQATLPVSTTVTKPIFFAVHAKRFFDLVKDLRGDPVFFFKSSQLSISSKNQPDTVIKLSTMSAELFPPFAQGIENFIDMDAKLLAKALDQIENMIPTSNANQALNGLLIEIDQSGLSLVATDGHTLAHLHTSLYNLKQYSSWVLPKRSVSELRKILEISMPERIFLGTCQSQLVFSGGNFIFYTKTLVQKYPDYKAALDKQDFDSGKINAQDIMATLKRASTLLAGKFIASKLSFEKNKLSFELENPEIGSLHEALKLKDYSGKEICATFYSPYLLTTLGQMVEQEEFTFYIKSFESPIFFSNFQEQLKLESTYLVMPVVTE